SGQEIDRPRARRPSRNGDAPSWPDSWTKAPMESAVWNEEGDDGPRDFGSPDGVSSLRDAARQADLAIAGRGSGLENGAAAWDALITGSFRFVDHFEVGGRCYVLARARTADVPPLGVRERAVLSMRASALPL